MELNCITMATPVGMLTLVAGSRGLRAVLWPGEPLTRIGPEPITNTNARAQEHLDDAVGQLAEYFAGTRTEFDVRLDPHGTDFQLAAWDELRRIPYGETITYGEQAARLGDLRKSRAVGAANGRNPISIIVPCHRVVGANGKLTGFAGGLDAKDWLLRHERGQETLPL